MGLNPLDRLVRDYSGFDMMYEAYDPSYEYEAYDPSYDYHDYSPDLARAIASFLEGEVEEAAKQEAATKTPPSTHLGE